MPYLRKVELWKQLTCSRSRHEPTHVLQLLWAWKSIRRDTQQPIPDVAHIAARRAPRRRLQVVCIHHTTCVIHPQRSCDVVIRKSVGDAWRNRCVGTGVTEDALLEHAGDIVCGAFARSAVDGGFGCELDLHQTEGFALVANVTEDAAGLLHYHS